MNFEDVKAIAIHLPQFHPIPENDQWWGRGFTEWTNVAKAKPLYPGHYQPHIPSDLGFYDLRLPEARKAQADLARQKGLTAFCYYHYWFGGRRILERPVDEIVSSGEPNFPFCLCWANENWTRTWDGQEKSVLLAQDYGPEDDVAHIKALIPILKDARYLRIEEKPALFIYRADQLPDPSATVSLWRKVAREAGVGELFLGAFLTADFDVQGFGFDVGVEFCPNNFARLRKFALKRAVLTGFYRFCARFTGTTQPAIHLYEEMAASMSAAAPPERLSRDRWMRCATPGWDNSPRRRNRPIIFAGSTPGRFENWLRELVSWTRQNIPSGRRYIFINAWNEWAEGNHLEPDLRNGHAYLDAVANVFGETEAKVESFLNSPS